MKDDTLKAVSVAMLHLAHIRRVIRYLERDTEKCMDGLGLVSFQIDRAVDALIDVMPREASDG